MCKKLLVFLLLASMPALVFAGTTGKIAGKVVDKSTGAPLPGANIIIVGTTMGAASNADGYYFIINIPVGTYTVKATMMGYHDIETQNVQSIQDLTTTINFALDPAVLDIGEEVVITAERPLVRVDATASSREVDGDQIMLMPKIDTFQDAISVQAGVVGNANIRGGRSTELSYMVDGMSVKNPLLGGVGAQINRNAINEIMLLTGGFSAEYGEAMSGVVNVVTKEGGAKYTGQLRYTTDKLWGEGDFGRDLYMSDDNTYELGFGGPVPLVDKLRFYLSGRLFTTDDTNPGEKVLDPAGNDLGKHRYHSGQQEYSAQIKFTYRFNPNMKLQFGGFKARNQWDTWEWLGSYNTTQLEYLEEGGIWSYTPSTSMLDHGFYYRDADNVLFAAHSDMQKSEQWKLDWTHTLSANTFYTANVTYFSNYQQRGKRMLRDEQDSFLSLFDNWYEDYEFVPIVNRDTDGDGKWDEFSYVQMGYSNTPKFPQDNPYGISNVFGGGGDTRIGSREYQSDYFGTKWDLVSQVTVNHQIKAGFEYFQHKMSKNYNSLPWDPVPFEDIYEYKPKTGALYVLDKMEYEGLVINAGLRLDYIEPEASAREDALDTTEGATYIKADTKWQISPRLGISHPVNDRTVLHFNYGWFFETPRFNSLYDFAVMPARLLRRGNQRIGNPNLEAQKTKAWEFGFAYQFSDVMSLDITGFYKDMYDVEGIRFVPAVPNNYSVLTNSEYGKSYGLEFTLKKRYSNYISGQANYTLMWSRGTSSDQYQHYQLVTNGPPDPYTGEMKIYPQVDYWLDFDERHNANVNIDFRIPKGQGPTLFGVKLLENFGINLLWNFHSGRPYTRRDYRGNQVGEYNGARQPFYMRTDARINKDFDLFGLHYSLFLEVENLFNTKRPLTVYARTGSPDYDGIPVTEGQFTGGYESAEYKYGQDFDGDGTLSNLEYVPFDIDGDGVIESGTYFGEAEGYWSDPQYGANADLGVYELNPTPLNERAQFEASTPRDINGDGVIEGWVGVNDGYITQTEYYNAYMRYKYDGYARKTNFMLGRRMWLGLQIYF